MSSAMYAKQVSIRLSIAHHNPDVNLNPMIYVLPAQFSQMNVTYSVRVFSLFKVFTAGMFIIIIYLSLHRYPHSG
jgi:hypothetical protein